MKWPCHESAPHELPEPRGRQVKGREGCEGMGDAVSMAASGPAGAGEVAEEALIERCQKGEREAFDVIIERYKDRVVSYLAYMVGDEEEAQDLAQEVFIRAYLSIGKFRGDCSLQTWLYRIAHNLGVDHLRRRGRSPEQFSLDAPVQLERGEIERQWAGEVSDPEEEVERAELVRAVRRAVGMLSEKLREVVVLHDLLQLSYEEVARILRCPVGTVKSRLFHARKELRRLLGPMLGEG